MPDWSFGEADFDSYHFEHLYPQELPDLQPVGCFFPVLVNNPFSGRICSFYSTSLLFVTIHGLGSWLHFPHVMLVTEWLCSPSPTVLSSAAACQIKLLEVRKVGVLGVFFLSLSK